MQDKTTKKYNNDGSVTLFGVFNEVKEDIDKKLSELPKGETKTKKITYRLFAKVVLSYLRISFNEVLNKGVGVELYNRFGELRAVKTFCNRYVPTTVKWEKVNGKLTSKRVKIDLNKTKGYMFFIFWDCPKSYRHYRFTPTSKWKRLLFKKQEEGMEYLDMSLLSYGRNASDSYIQKIK